MRTDGKGNRGVYPPGKEGYMKHTDGYGIIRRSITCDSRISIGAKGLYAYFCTYAGSKNYCFPSVSLICGQLNINRCTFYKYLNELRKAGYVVTAASRENGRFGNTRYVIMTDSASEDTEDDTCVDNSGSGVDNSPKKPHGHSRGGVSVDGDTVYEKTVYGDTVCGRSYSNNNNNKNNNSKSNINKSKNFNINNKTCGLADVGDDEELSLSIKRFVEMRKEMGKPVTRASMKILMEELNNLSRDKHIQARIVDRSTMNSWMHFYPLKDREDMDIVCGREHIKEVYEWLERFRNRKKTA